jgi:hypothetical protein
VVAASRFRRRNLDRCGLPMRVSYDQRGSYFIREAAILWVIGQCLNPRPYNRSVCIAALLPAPSRCHILPHLSRSLSLSLSLPYSLVAKGDRSMLIYSNSPHGHLTRSSIDFSAASTLVLISFHYPHHLRKLIDFLS